MKRKVILTMMTLLFFVFPLVLHAQDEEEGSTEVSFRITNNDRYKLTIKVGKGGELRDGSQHIVNGTVIYEIGVGEEKQFRIIPDKGYKVANLYYARPNLDGSRKSMLGEVKNGYVTIHTESTEMQLDVTFKKNPTSVVTHPADSDEADNKQIEKQDFLTSMGESAFPSRVVLKKEPKVTKQNEQVKKSETSDKDDAKRSDKDGYTGMKEDTGGTHWSLLLILLISLILLLGSILVIYERKRKKT